MLLPSLVSAETNYTFENGSAVIICQNEKGIPEEDFNKVFPAWTTHTLEKYEAGIVEMVQYTSDLNKGIVIMINKHDSAKENMKEAERFAAENQRLASEAGVSLDESTCRIIQMGPIWLKPKS